MPPIRALLYAPTPEAADAFIQQSGDDPALRLDTTTDLLAFLRMVNSTDIILLHHDLPSGAASALAHWVSSTQTGKRIVVVNAPSDPLMIVHYYEVGATGYLLAGEPASALMDVLELLEDGVPRVDGRIGFELLRRVAELEAISEAIAKRSYPLTFEHYSRRMD